MAGAKKKRHGNQETGSLLRQQEYECNFHVLFCRQNLTFITTNNYRRFWQPHGLRKEAHQIKVSRSPKGG